jgi:hypothetical protein
LAKLSGSCPTYRSTASRKRSCPSIVCTEACRACSRSACNCAMTGGHRQPSPAHRLRCNATRTRRGRAA